MPYESASKLVALQALRVAVHQQKPSQLVSVWKNGSPELLAYHK